MIFLGNERIEVVWLDIWMTFVPRRLNPLFSRARMYRWDKIDSCTGAYVHMLIRVDALLWSEKFSLSVGFACWVTEPFPIIKNEYWWCYLGITRRSVQVMSDILSLCKQPQTERQLMGKTSLSRRMLQVYLSQLQSKRLLEVHHSTTKYATAPEGFRFSERYAEVLEL
jgi:predicted transcriptional regulator